MREENDGLTPNGTLNECGLPPCKKLLVENEFIDGRRTNMEYGEIIRATSRHVPFEY